MNVLAIDTCFGACSAAVGLSLGDSRGASSLSPSPSTDGLFPRPDGLISRPDGLSSRPDLLFSRPDLLFSRYEEMATGHAERLMPMIEEVMHEAGCTFAALDAIAVTEGPGSFTGLRVGVAAARALALGTGLPIRAASSLHVMAVRAAAELDPPLREGALAVCVDARNNQVYAQAFSAGCEVLTPPMILPPDAAAALCEPVHLIIVGSGAAAVTAAALQSGRPAEARLPGLLPDARHLAAMAPSLPVRKPLIPVYLRAPDAKPPAGKALPRV